VPKSRARAKTAYTAPPTRSPKKRVSPPWVAPLMLGCFLIGIVWLVLFYVTGGSLPISALRNWNLLIGFGFIIAGFGISTQWH
jgi:Cell division protein CrgA